MMRMSARFVGGDIRGKEKVNKWIGIGRLTRDQFRQVKGVSVCH